MIADEESQQALQIVDHQFHRLSVYKEVPCAYTMKDFCDFKGEKVTIVPLRKELNPTLILCNQTV